MMRNIKVQPWKEFINSNNFSLPKQDTIVERVTTNLSFYSGNYLMICAGISFFAVLLSPWIIVALGAGCALWYYFFVVHPAPIRAGNVELTILHKQGIVVGITLFLIFYTSGLTIFWVVGLCSSIVLAHSSFRQRSLKSKVDNVMDSFRGENELLVPMQFLSETVDTMHEEQDALRSADYQQKREAYHQLASNIRAKYDLPPHGEKDSEV